MIDSYQFDSKGLPIHCETMGSVSSDSAIIFLHGLASNATRWRELTSNFSLRDKSYLLAMDLRGHGHSMTFQHYQRRDWCTDVGTLIEILNKPTILVGHSMGAQIALDYAAQDQTHLRGLLLIDPVFPQALTGVLKNVAHFRWLFNLVAFSLGALNRMGIHKRHYPYRDLQKLDLKTRTFLAENPDKDIADLYMNPFTDLRYMPIANYLKDLVEVSRKLPSLADIDVPVLVLLSSGASTSNVKTNRKILSQIPDLEIKTIHADHWLLTEKPVEARTIIEAWCKERLDL